MIGNEWDIVLKDIFDSEEFNIFMNNIYMDYENFDVYPKREDIFKAFELTDYSDVKIVILGQDPYHQRGQANGLAFSVNKGVKMPPSLRNIFKEIKEDLGIVNTNTDLTNWANQGILLLNTVLTVKDSKPKSYANTYWNKFTDKVISRVSKKGNIIFLLWGNDAINKSRLICENNYILTSTHPSPLSAYRGFLGCRHFSKANNILVDLNKDIIDWSTNENNN
ncbi:uracil-DNA glycosylase [Helcococcus kunzii]|uniref:Uracil-DNA glycosylase n=1 Tax=Helcococcus kunzii ATCC 51366 TaxID=883114 RepID=H3NN78_9FIRM|nr:uracil-DNA glycosylase [Helcococcus kunzii]EHR34482.1 uracil-DNA glycosylase [Helcococcus kunzii ATCC 51366]MCT1795481.1 uracil-DNA glycosylase [Helcococcus kunzii]MCT1989161.1 uracil-DNA glycosylase [Helcococcus kunzii]QUY64727.1 uracil-DNA glycosylase [Helcococcus kunzii]QZO77136.1 uracil-DNA glycosylase [Helcococcus kunzii]